MKTVKSVFFIICITCTMLVYSAVMFAAPSSAPKRAALPHASSQPAFDKAIAPFITRLNIAASVSDYQSLANDFTRISGAWPNEWLGYYYAAYCNTRIAWAYQNDGDKIGPYLTPAATQIQKAESLAGTDSKSLSEIYCIKSMIDRAYVFISPMSNGPKYGPSASKWIEKAKLANPDNPRALYLDGWVKYNTPKLWGGDKDKAKQLFTLALEKLKMAADASPFPHWGKQDCDHSLSQYQ